MFEERRGLLFLLRLLVWLWLQRLHQRAVVSFWIREIADVHRVVSSQNCDVLAPAQGQQVLCGMRVVSVYLACLSTAMALDVSLYMIHTSEVCGIKL